MALQSLVVSAPGSLDGKTSVGFSDLDGTIDHVISHTRAELPRRIHVRSLSSVLEGIIGVLTVDDGRLESTERALCALR